MNSDHELSILAQQKICEDVIINLISDDDILRNELIIKNAYIFSKLRSKFFPKEKLEAYAENYCLSFRNIGKPVTFVCVLAADTAFDELESFIDFIKCFDDCIKININFLLINCPKLSKNMVSNHDFDIFYNSFNKAVEKELLVTRREAIVIPINIILDNQFNIVEPNIIVKEFKSFENSDVGDITTQDILWTLDFYEREESLKNLNNKQAMIDLAIRKSIYPYARDTIFKKYDSHMDFLITSELHKRIVKCYRANCAIFNIQV